MQGQNKKIVEQKDSLLKAIELKETYYQLKFDECKELKKKLICEKNNTNNLKREKGHLKLKLEKEGEHRVNQEQMRKNLEQTRKDHDMLQKNFENIKMKNERMHKVNKELKNQFSNLKEQFGRNLFFADGTVQTFFFYSRLLFDDDFLPNKKNCFF